ncbi:hypothetical protein B0H11DRAFT_2103495 [Mycena galericulata]|nr:hypothetical protein B0H11DRAFT_2103495 [Mycena galericulata]
MVQDPEASKSVYNTSGPRRIVARAWRLLLPLREEQTFDALKAVYSFLCPKDASRETHAAYLDELFEGAGGGPPDLASLLLSHLNLHVQRAPHSMQSLFFVTHALDFLLTNSPSHVPFTEGLIRHGVITTFTHLAHIFSAAPSDEPAVKTLLKCAWDYLDIQFSGRLGYRLVGEAIRAGLFRAIIAAATLDNFPASVASVIETLGPYTAYYSVLSCISPALHDVKDLQASLVVTKSDLFNKWSDFWDLAQERMAIMRYYESDAYVSLKACDALECGQIHPKRQLVRCSRCKWRHYCSKRCQVVDWKDGHRSTCHSIHSIVQNEPEHFSTRDRSFLRALLDYDYKEWRLDILQHELEFLDAFPEDNPFILFDYRRGHMSFRILREGGPGELGELDLQWQDGIARAARSVGRIQSHAMVLPDGHDCVLRFFPMYSSSSALWDGLKQLKNEVDEGVGGSAPIHSQITGRILALASTVERLVVQIH